MNNLCCEINLFLACNACGRRWCGDCWSKELGILSHYESEDYRSGRVGYLRRMCTTSGRKVEYLNIATDVVLLEVAESNLDAEDKKYVSNAD